MAVTIKLFCEDSAHESTARALIARVAAELDIAIDVSVGTAKLGIPRLRQELQAFQEMLASAPGLPDVLVIIVDANGVGAAARRAEVDGLLDRSRLLHVAIGTPDPCVEQWLIGDPPSFFERFGVQPDIAATDDGDELKTRLVGALERGGRIVTQGGSEYADEIVDAMDLARACGAHRSLDTFLAELRAALKSASA